MDLTGFERLLAAIMFALGSVAASCLVNLNLRLYRAVGLIGFADYWTRQRTRLVMATRLLCAAAAVVLAGGFFGLW